MSREWRVVQLGTPMTFDHKTRWIVSRRKLSDDEVYTLMKLRFDCDLSGMLGIEVSSSMICGVSTIIGGTRADAEAECERLNGGGGLFDGWFGKEETDGEQDREGNQ